MSAFTNQAKVRLTNGELAIGFILRQSRTADIAAIGRTCGFDWFSIDMEHSSIDVDAAAQIVSAALPIGISALVRTPAPLYPNATRLLDAGAQGLIVPHVDSADEARFVASYSKYPPLGARSIASVQPQLRFQDRPSAEAMRQVNAEMLTIVMLETPMSIENADDIAAVPGIDILLIGSNDLCAEMGIPGQFSHPDLAHAYRKIVAACKRHGKFAGMSGIHDPKLLQNFIDFGVRFVSGGTDLSFLMKAAKERAALLRNLLEAS